MAPTKKIKVEKEGIRRKEMITVEVKKEIIGMHEQGMQVAAIARYYNKSTSTICTILKNKEQLMRLDVAKGVTRISKQRPRILEDIEKFLLEWIKEQQREGDAVTEQLICEKAKALYADLVCMQPGTSAGNEEGGFKASRGWFDNFKRRSGIQNDGLQRYFWNESSSQTEGSISTGNGVPHVNMPHNHVPDPHSVALARCRQSEDNQVTCILDDEDSLPEKSQSGKETPAASTSSSSLLKLNNPSGMKSTKLQPIAPKPSPQTIKITRAAAMQQQLPPPPPPPPEQEKEPDEVCLRWNSHHTNMKSSFPSLLEREQYVDVTLCCEGKTIRCHKLILSSCSSYFDEILSTITPFQHPVIFLKGTPFWILKSLIDFMYVGEVHIEQSKLQEILEVAEILKIKGLTGKKPQQNGEKKDDRASSNESSLQSTSIPIPVSIPTPIMPMKVLKAMPPLRLAVNKDVDPLSLLKPTFFEEPTTLRKILPKTELSRKQSLAAERSKVDVIPPRRILPKRRLKRKSSEPEEREASPPPLVLRKGTKSRPVVKAPKYYHMEYDDPNDKLMKLEDEPRESEHHFDIVNVKSEPIDEDFDIVENEVAFGQLSTTQDNITEDSEAHDKDEEPLDQHKDDSDAPMEATPETPNDASFEAENSKEDDPDYCEDECNGKEVDDTSELVAPDPEKDGND